jgi:hypothetical protein
MTSDQLKLLGPAYRLTAVSRGKLAEDALEVRLDGVDRDVHLTGHLSGIEHVGDVSQDFPFAFGQRLDGHDRGLVWSWDVPGSRELIAAQGRCQQTLVAAGQFRITF